MYYTSYLIEIKNRTFLIFFSWSITFLTCYFYKETLLCSIINTNSFNNCYEENFYFIFTDVTEVFYSYLNIIFFISNQTFLVIILYHFIMFLLPGLYYFEYKKVLQFFNKVIFLWLLSVLFINNILVPVSWNFFLSFNNNKSQSFFSMFFEAKISEFLNFYTSLYYLFFISSLFLFSLLSLIIFSSDSLIQIKSFRRFFYYSFLMFSTLSTPPDVLSQLLLSLSLIITYEIFIFFTLISKNLVNTAAS